MKAHLFFIGLVCVMLAACGAAGTDRIPIAELPDPAIYALLPSDLPDIAVDWQQSYNQTSELPGFNKGSYRAYQAYQPGSTANELDAAYAVNNDVYLYETDVHKSDLPQPPAEMGNIRNITWQPATQLHTVGDKSAVWKTTLGDQFTPVWWLEFYQGHAYVRISLFGFPDQVAPAVIYKLADTVAGRLPTSADELRSDVTTPAVAQAQPVQLTAVYTDTAVLTPLAGPSTAGTIPILSYTAPPGETGMVAFADETGGQLSDGVEGTSDILADQGSGSAYEWVGWTDQTEPVTLTFTLADDAPVSAVELGMYHRDGLGIFVPNRVEINGVSYDLAADAVPNNQRTNLTFSGSFGNGMVTIVLYHRGRGWIMLDEVRFLGANP